MKRLIVLLSIVMLFVTGCSISQLSNTNFNGNIRALLSKKVNMYSIFFSFAFIKYFFNFDYCKKPYAVSVFPEKRHSLGADTDPRRISIILYLVSFVNRVTQDIVLFSNFRHNI